MVALISFVSLFIRIFLSLFCDLCYAHLFVSQFVLAVLPVISLLLACLTATG